MSTIHVSVALKYWVLYSQLYQNYEILEDPWCTKKRAFDVVSKKLKGKKRERESEKLLFLNW